MSISRKIKFLLYVMFVLLLGIGIIFLINYLLKESKNGDELDKLQNEVLSNFEMPELFIIYTARDEKKPINVVLSQLVPILNKTCKSDVKACLALSKVYKMQNDCVNALKLLKIYADRNQIKESDIEYLRLLGSHYEINDYCGNREKANTIYQKMCEQDSIFGCKKLGDYFSAYYNPDSRQLSLEDMDKAIYWYLLTIDKYNFLENHTNANSINNSIRIDLVHVANQLSNLYMKKQDFNNSNKWYENELNFYSKLFQTCGSKENNYCIENPKEANISFGQFSLEMYELCNAYFYGGSQNYGRLKITSKDFIKASQWCQFNADNQDKIITSAKTLDRDFVENNFELIYWTESVMTDANKMKENAEEKLTDMYFLGGYGLKNDYNRAFGYALSLKNSSNPTISSKGYYTLGLMNFYGLGIDKDFGQAGIYFINAAEKGNAMAQLQVATMYDQGIGFPKDSIQAFAWITAALANNLPSNFINVADQERRQINNAYVDMGIPKAAEDLGKKYYENYVIPFKERH